mgnify:CR=1 FL=1
MEGESDYAERAVAEFAFEEFELAYGFEQPLGDYLHII